MSTRVSPPDVDESPRRPACRLTGTDGNVFAIIGKVAKTLKSDGQPERATEFTNRAFRCSSYDEVLGLTFDYVDPS